MRIFRIDDDSLSCHVIAVSKESALSVQVVKDYFADVDKVNELEATELNGAETLTIDFHGTKITHTISEWEYIYEGCGNMLISQSEY